MLHIKLQLAKYYKDSEMTAFISERNRNSKYRVFFNEESKVSGPKSI